MAESINQKTDLEKKFSEGTKSVESSNELGLQLAKMREAVALKSPTETMPIAMAESAKIAVFKTITPANLIDVITTADFLPSEIEQALLGEPINHLGEGANGLNVEAIQINLILHIFDEMIHSVEEYHLYNENQKAITYLIDCLGNKLVAVLKKATQSANKNPAKSQKKDPDILNKMIVTISDRRKKLEDALKKAFLTEKDSPKYDVIIFTQIKELIENLNELNQYLEHGWDTAISPTECIHNLLSTFKTLSTGIEVSIAILKKSLEANADTTPLITNLLGRFDLDNFYTKKQGQISQRINALYIEDRIFVYKNRSRIGKLVNRVKGALTLKTTDEIELDERLKNLFNREKKDMIDVLESFINGLRPIALKHYQAIEQYQKTKLGQFLSIEKNLKQN